MTNIINVLDRELSCHRDGVFPPGERKETIEYGICEIDRTTLKIIRTISIPVKPTMSTITQYCTELTGWTYAKLMKQGVFDAEACRRLEVKHASKSRLVITDSSDELESVREQCSYTGVPYPFGEETLNISLWFSIVTGVKKRLSLQNKLAYLGLEFEGKPHRASVDAFNIARLFIALVEQARLGLPTNCGKSDGGRIILP